MPACLEVFSSFTASPRAVEGWCHYGDALPAPHPGESADGHAITVRHEVAHVLSWCTGRGLDYSHSHAAVWGPQGVVHVRPPRDPWRAAPRLLAR